MGERGPVPKRDSQRRRSKPEAGPVEVAVDGEPVIPVPDAEWHPIARMMWDGLGRSGQAVFYTSSDWSTAFALCESMSREFKPQPVVNRQGKPVAGEDGAPVVVDMPPRAAALTAWSKWLSGLMALEGDRRRLRLELNRKPEEAPSSDGPSHLDEYRRRLTG